MSSNKVFAFLLVLPLVAHATIWCMHSEVVRPNRPVECYSNYCRKSYTEYGVTYGCDTFDECKKAFSDDLVRHRLTIDVCYGNDNRRTCCCNYDYCNGSLGKTVFVSVLAALLAAFYI